ncbi:MAG: hypothetical protein IJX99_08830 [Clostridia bacterium]|nr:hypothetical protein [Clostridia bacterium]
MMRLGSQKGYSLIEIGVGLVLITIFMVCGVTMLKGTHNTYRLVEQKSIAMSYLLRAVEIELLDDTTLTVTDNPNDTVIRESNALRKVSVTTIPANDITITTTVEALPTKNGVSYLESRVKLLTSNAEYFIRKNDESSRRVLTIKTLKIEGVETDE